MFLIVPFGNFFFLLGVFGWHCVVVPHPYFYLITPKKLHAAYGLHEKLAQQYGQQYIGTDDYYQRIENTIRKRFPEAFPNSADDEDSAESKPQRKATTVVASAKRSTAPKQIKLTASQLALSKKLKLTPEQYAREVLKLENR